MVAIREATEDDQNWRTDVLPTIFEWLEVIASGKI